jgi:Ran GTPase-activating protein (RanGAP) involved in mRNA processing and transport
MHQAVYWLGLAAVLYALKHVDVSGGGDGGHGIIQEHEAAPDAQQLTATQQKIHALHQRCCTPHAQQHHGRGDGHLSLGWMDLDVADVTYVARLLRANSASGVTKLRVFANKRVGDAGVAALAAMLRNDRHIRELWLNGLDMTDTGLAALASALRHNRGSLRMLMLSNNRVTARGVALLASALAAGSARVDTLWLSGHAGIGDAGVAALATHLLHGDKTPLKELLLHACGITDVGAASLATALRSNTQLRLLQLDSNEIGDAGATAIAAALADGGNAELETLAMASNRIGDAGVRSFIATLRANRWLRSLRLFHNDAITAAMRTELFAADERFGQGMNAKT